MVDEPSKRVTTAAELNAFGLPGNLPSFSVGTETLPVELRSVLPPRLQHTSTVPSGESVRVRREVQLLALVVWSVRGLTQEPVSSERSLDHSKLLWGNTHDVCIAKLGLWHVRHVSHRDSGETGYFFDFLRRIRNQILVA